MTTQDNNDVLDEQLEEVAGGAIKEQLTAGLLGISALVTPFGTTNTEAKGNYLPYFEKNSVVLKNQENTSIVKYLTEAPISEAQNKAFNMTNDLLKKYNNDHLSLSYNVSSERYQSNAKKTSLESELDEAVKNGDLPLPDFTVEDIRNTKDSIVSKNNSDKQDIKFILCPSLDALHLHEIEECQDGDIVNLASQFNALESVSNRPTSVKHWYIDKTQGPYCALQSVAATKHREAAHLQDKLTDGMKEALKYCIIDGKPITAKYPNLYKGGYLEMMEIKDEKDMEKFLAFLEDEKNLEKHMKVLMQWVKCEGTGKKQLQFFTAAPSFQGYNEFIWSSNSRIMQLRRKACIKLVEIQYRAMAQAAAIISAKSGKPVRLHVTMVGHGVFNNPPETVSAALNALKEGLQGAEDATVFLHNRPNKPNIWQKKGKLKQLGINFTSLDKWENSAQ